MASDRPDYLPEWATASFALAVSGQQNKVRPPAGWRANGWDENEEPPCNYENWQMNRAYDWLRYLDNNVVRGATAIVCASDATDAMIDMATSADSAVNKWICDGTDDDVQIQAAIDAVELAGGGLVLLSEGQFVIEAGLVIDGANVTVAGLGPDATEILLGANQVANFDILTLSSVNNCMVRDLSINGNKANQVADPGEFPGIVLNTATNCQVRNVGIYNIYALNPVGNVAAVIIENAGGESNIIERCHLHDNTAGLWDIRVEAGSKATISKCIVPLGALIMGAYTRVVDCEFPAGLLTFTTGANFSLASRNTIVGGAEGIQIQTTNNVAIENNTIHAPTANGIIITTCDDLLIAGNIISECGTNGIEATAMDDSSIVGNIIRDCSQALDNNHDGIAIEAGSDNNSIVGNQIRQAAAPPQHYHGIYIAAAAGLQWVAGNDCKSSSQIAGREVTDNNNARFPLYSVTGGNEPYEVWDGTVGAHVAATVRMFNRVG